MPRAGRRWSREEVALLEKYASISTLLAISQALGRTEASVKRKVRYLKLRCTHAKPRSEWLRPERREMTPEQIERANALHLADLKAAGHTRWPRFAAIEADTLPQRVSVPDSTFLLSSCVGSPAAMCAE